MELKKRAVRACVEVVGCLEAFWMVRPNLVGLCYYSSCLCVSNSFSAVLLFSHGLRVFGILGMFWGVFLNFAVL